MIGLELEDWEKKEVSSLVKEAEALRTQKLRLEEQISRAQDASLSVSRVSSLQLEAPSWQASTGDEVLDATQRGLQVDLRLLRRRLLDAEAAVAKDEEKAVALEEQKDQAKDTAGLLRKLQVLQQSLEERGRDGNALQQREQRMGEAMDALTARRSAAQEEADALRAQLQACHEAMAKASKQQREVRYEASRARARLAEGRRLWEGQVQMRRASLRAEEMELGELQERRDACQLAKMDAQRTTAELHGKLVAVRTQSLEEHLDFKVRSLQGEIRRLEGELRGLRARDAEEALRKRHAQEDLCARGTLLRDELRAFEACRLKLQNLSLEMQQEAMSLELELQEAHELLRAEKALGATMMRRAASAPQLRKGFEERRPSRKPR